jgi:hypothetical protein
MRRIINPRLQAGVVLAMAVALRVPLLAQSSTPASEQISISAVQRVPSRSLTMASAVARVQRVAVRGTPDALEVEIETSGAAVAPDTQAITGPDRIIIDFPGALPAEALRSFQVKRGPLKGIRTGLFFKNPPITRIVLDLAGPQAYVVSSAPNAIVVRLGAAKADAAKMDSVRLNGGDGAPHGAALRTAELGTNTKTPARVFSGTALRAAAAVSVAEVSGTVASATQANAPAPSSRAPSAPPVPEDAVLPPVVVTFENNLLRIHSEKGTMAQVLFEVQRRTQAEIAIPSGAEQEQVVADIGPAPSRDVLAALLNGSTYNFIFVGTEDKLERVILTQREASPF